MHLTDAKKWLRELREFHRAQPDTAASEIQFFVKQHATYCKCRDLTETKIRKLVLQSLVYQRSENRAPSAKPSSLVLRLRDSHEDTPENRRAVELIFVFDDGETPCVISAWREGSPRLDSGDDCRSDPDNPPCKMDRQLRNNIRPRGRL